MQRRIRSMILCALFAAICALLSQLSIPLPFTPIIINLATIAVFTAGGMLGAKRGAAAMLLYVALGAVGVPVFHGFQGGLGMLAGPTGGYLIGYIAGAFVVGLLVKTDCGFWRFCAAMLAGLAACYALGTAWFMLSTGTALGASLTMCVLPFMPGDLAKIALSAFLCQRLRPILK